MATSATITCTCGGTVNLSLDMTSVGAMVQGCCDSCDLYYWRELSAPMMYH